MTHLFFRVIAHSNTHGVRKYGGGVADPSLEVLGGGRGTWHLRERMAKGRLVCDEGRRRWRSVQARGKTSKGTASVDGSVCVVHIKPFFLPVDIQHTQCPCRFFLLEWYKLCGHKKNTTQRYYIVMQWAEETTQWHREQRKQKQSNTRGCAVRCGGSHVLTSLLIEPSPSPWSPW